MKVIIKCGDNRFKWAEAEKFFLDEIYPILDFGIAIEISYESIFVYEKNGKEKKNYTDDTAEVIVELTEEARGMALDKSISEKILRKKSGKFFDEAMAIRKIEELNPFFSREYYSCNYAPGSKTGK
jgi:hypothetical protein